MVRDEAARPPILFFVIPCYNDAQTLDVTAPVFLKKMTDLIDAGKADAESRILLVNDGSSDGTWEKIAALHDGDAHFCGVDLAVNTGEQNALLAGMQTAVREADCVITMDSDLQDDIDAVDRMLELYSEGKEAVFGVRADRSEDSLSERVTSALFYWVMEKLHTGMIREHANYRLLSRDAVRAVLERAHGDFYLPCLVGSLPFPSATVPHMRTSRAAGSSSYTFSKRLRLGLLALKAHALFPARRDAAADDEETDFPIRQVLW